ncbi:hemolysin family protein [Janibacter sp. G1551]|uniref:hemolysin family protein n=1 Tax=Janibacter sp. G1551 TaxID=3420440 RepID=UPI003D083FAC
MNGYLIPLALSSVLLAFVLTLAESSIQRISTVRTEELLDERRPGAESLTRIVGDKAAYISVLTFLRAVTEAGAAVLLTVAVTMRIEDDVKAVLVAIAIMAVVSFVVVGVSPRTLGRQHSDGVALAVAPFVVQLRRVLGPLARLLVTLGNAVTPGRGYRDGPFQSESELRGLVDLAGDEALIEADEREMIHSVFELGDTLAREVMVPRTDMVCIEMEKVGRQAVSLFLRSGFSRIPVVGEGSDDIRGLLYFKDVARRLNDDAQSAELPVEHFMRPMPYVPESKPVDDLLREMQRDQTHFAVVIDEYGGTAGLVTIEDILEEIVGEIADEYDREAPGIEDLGDGRWRVPASLHVDDLRDEFDVDLEEEDVDTVGGLIAKTLGVVPILGSHCEVAGLSLTADKMSGRRHRIASVIVERLPEIDVPEPARGRESRRDAADQSHREREGAT